MEQQLINLINELGGDGANVGQVMADTFDKMEDAEQRISRRMRATNDPKLQQKYWGAFLALCPPVVLRGLDDALYNAHVEEILDRVRDGKSLKPFTDAEQLASIAHASMEHPPDHNTYAYYLWLFVRIYDGNQRALKIFDDLNSGPVFERVEGLMTDARNGVEPYAIRQVKEEISRLKSDRDELPRELREVPERVLAKL